MFSIPKFNKVTMADMNLKKQIHYKKSAILLQLLVSGIHKLVEPLYLDPIFIFWIPGQLSNAKSLLSAGLCQLSTVSCQLSAVYCKLSTVSCLISV